MGFLWPERVESGQWRPVIIGYLRHPGNSRRKPAFKAMWIVLNYSGGYRSDWSLLAA
jgi:hypothetical protein